MSQTTTKVVRGRVSPNLIKALDRFFDGRLETVLGELIQNSRRAGAKRLDVGIHQAEVWRSVSVRDDGKGCDDPDVLLAGGDSAWSAKTMSTEDPAGLGVFSISTLPGVHSIAMRSKGWRIPAMPKQVFSGEMESEVITEEVTSCREFEGFEVSFGYAFKRAFIPQGEEFDQLMNEVGRILSYTGIAEVYLNGRRVPQKDFLKDAVIQKEFGGVRVGLYSHATHYASWGTVNFFGVQAALPEEFNRAVRFLSPHWGKGRGMYRVRMDMTTTARVSLQLPDRKQVKVTPELIALASEVEAWALTELNKLHRGEHTMTYETWKEARVTVEDLPESLPLVKLVSEDRNENCGCGTAWRPWDRIELTGEGGPFLLRDLSQRLEVFRLHPNSTEHQVNVLRALQVSAPQTVLIAPAESGQEGYKWLEDIPTMDVTGVSVRTGQGAELPVHMMELDAGRLRLVPERKAGSKKTAALIEVEWGSKVASITLHTTAKHGRTEVKTALPTDLLISPDTEDYFSDPENVKFIVTSEMPTANDIYEWAVGPTPSTFEVKRGRWLQELIDITVAVGWSHSDELSGDEVEEEKSQVEMGMRRIFEDLLLSSEAYAQHRLDEFMDELRGETSLKALLIGDTIGKCYRMTIQTTEQYHSGQMDNVVLTATIQDQSGKVVAETTAEVTKWNSKLFPPRKKQTKRKKK